MSLLLQEFLDLTYESWGIEEDEQLKVLFKSGMNAKEIAAKLQRQPSAIRGRLKKINLLPRDAEDNFDRMAEIRDKHPRAYMSWSTEEDGELKDLFESGMNAKEIAAKLQRQPSAIRSRLKKINLIPKDNLETEG